MMTIETSYEVANSDFAAFSCAAARSSRTSALLLVAVLSLATIWGARASAFIPDAERTMKEIAKVNRASGRTMAVQLKLTMSVGDREPIASAELISHPSGLARLEIRGFRGRTDRYLLSGSELLAATDGRRLERSQPMLQPFFLLQPSSETTLRAALETFGVQSQWIGLAPCGEQDCFVIGDPRLSAPLPTPPAPMTGDEGDEGDEADEADEVEVIDDPLVDQLAEGDADVGEDESDDPVALDELEGPLLTLPEDGLVPRLWVDTRGLEVRRIDRASGVFVIFGPIKRFATLEVPGWFEIHEPGARIIRFDVDHAVPVNAPPTAFSRKWLLAPTDPPATGAAPADNPVGVQREP